MTEMIQKCCFDCCVTVLWKYWISFSHSRGISDWRYDDLFLFTI